MIEAASIFDHDEGDLRTLDEMWLEPDRAADLGPVTWSGNRQVLEGLLLAGLIRTDNDGRLNGLDVHVGFENVDDLEIDRVCAGWLG